MVDLGHVVDFEEGLVLLWWSPYVRVMVMSVESFVLESQFCSCV